MANTLLDDDGDGLAWLSEEEREALNADDGEEDLLREIAEEEDEEEEAEAVAPSQPESAPAEPAPSAQAPTEEPPQQPFQPVYVAPLPADFEQRAHQLVEARKKLVESYENGDIDLATFQQQQRQLNEHEWQLRAAALKADMAREQHQQAIAQRWAWEQEAYFRKPENRAFRDDPVISHAFEGALKLLAADEGNTKRDMAWFLEEAGRLSREKVRELAAGLGMQAGEPAKPAGGAPPPAKRGRPNAPPPPPTLGGIPTAMTPDPAADEFAYLDKLNGLEAERALAKLSPDQLDRYLSQ